MSDLTNEEMKAALHDFVKNGSDEEVTAFYERVKEDLRLAGIDIDALEDAPAENAGEQKEQIEG